MDNGTLKKRVQARDRLLEQAYGAQRQLEGPLLQAIHRGQLEQAADAAAQHQRELRELGENLRIYQAELHAQADELAASQASTAAQLERFAALFRGMPVATLLVARNGEVLESNQMAEQLLQLRGPGGQTMFMHRLVDPNHFQAAVRPAFLRAEAEGHARVDRLLVLGQRQQRLVGELHISRLPGRSAADCSFACAIVDRSEQVQMLQQLEATARALQASESFLADAARVARTGGWDLSLQPRQMRWSTQLRALLALQPQEPASLEALLARCEPHDRPLLASTLAAAERGRAFEIEIDMIDASGTRLRAAVVGEAACDAQGRVQRVHGVLQDISHQHLVRRELSDLHDRLDMANDAGGIGIWDFDLERQWLACDERMTLLLGLTEPVQGGLLETLEPLLLPDSALLLRKALQAAVAELAPLNLELHLAREADGGERWLHLTGRAHPDAGGRAVRLVGCGWDSSREHAALRLQAAKEAAEDASRAKTAFLSRMSHEQRTPLNAILGFSQIMRLEAEAGDLVLKPHRVALIESAARHLLELVNEVLDVSSIEAGRMRLDLKQVDLAGVVAEAVALVLGAAERAGVQLQVLHEPDAPSCAVADRLRLKEVLINLLSNAVKYNRSGGQVVLSVRGEPGRVLIDVADTGPGLSEQQIQQLFQPFNRVGAEYSGIEGSGMGLFVSRRYMELMQGGITVSSRPGGGSIFTVHLTTGS